jgi:hypothetical protein
VALDTRCYDSKGITTSQWHILTKAHQVATKKEQAPKRAAIKAVKKSLTLPKSISPPPKAAVTAKPLPPPDKPNWIQRIVSFIKKVSLRSQKNVKK